MSDSEDTDKTAAENKPSDQEENSQSDLEVPLSQNGESEESLEQDPLEESELPSSEEELQNDDDSDSEHDEEEEEKNDGFHVLVMETSEDILTPLEHLSEVSKKLSFERYTKVEAAVESMGKKRGEINLVMCDYISCRGKGGVIYNFVKNFLPETFFFLVGSYLPSETEDVYSFGKRTKHDFFFKKPVDHEKLIAALLKIAPTLHTKNDETDEEDGEEEDASEEIT